MFYLNFKFHCIILSVLDYGIKKEEKEKGKQNTTKRGPQREVQPCEILPAWGREPILYVCVSLKGTPEVSCTSFSPQGEGHCHSNGPSYPHLERWVKHRVAVRIKTKL